MQKYYEHWTEVPKNEWHWPSFTPQELASKGNGSILVDYNAISLLQILRDYIGKPLVITSAYRDPVYNAKIGGAPLSMHKQGRAFDISLKGHSRDELADAARLVGFGGVAYAKTFIHVDTGRVRTWKY